MTKKTDPQAAIEKRQKADMQMLGKLPAFKRFLWRVIQSAGIFAKVTDGSQQRNLDYFEGARDLGLAILAMVEEGQPASHPHSSVPILTLIQTFLEEANPPPSERDDDEERSERYDRNAELDDEPDDSQADRT